jgi:hypothetical protein
VNAGEITTKNGLLTDATANKEESAANLEATETAWIKRQALNRRLID